MYLRLRAVCQAKATLSTIQRAPGIDTMNAQLPVAQRQQPAINHHVVPRQPAAINSAVSGDHVLTFATATPVVVLFGQQQHRIGRGMVQAVAAAFDGEAKAGGIGKFAVFRFGVHEVVQLQLAGRQHPQVVGLMYHHLIRVGYRVLRGQRRQRQLSRLPEGIALI